MINYGQRELGYTRVCERLMEMSINDELGEYQELKEYASTIYALRLDSPDCCGRLHNYETYLKNENTLKDSDVCNIYAKLGTVGKIYASNKDELSKGYQMLYLFDSSNEMWENLEDIVIKYGHLETTKNIYKGIKLFRKLEQTKEIDDLKYIFAKRSLYASYDYAKFIINAYINEEISYDKQAFYNKYGLSDYGFDLCLTAVQELNCDLYDKYLDAKLKNEKLVMEMQKKAIVSITDGIKTYQDNYDVLDFWKNMSIFLHYKLFRQSVRKFVTKYYPQEYKLINDYLIESGAYADGAVKPLDVDTLYKTNVSVLGRELTKEDTDYILAYIKNNNLPLINHVYLEARKRYLMGELDLSLINLESLEDTKCTIIPKGRR